MSIDLTLLVIDVDLGEWAFSHTVLDLGRRSELWDVIMGIEERKARLVPKPFYSYLGKDSNGNTQYGDTQRIPYGEALKYVLASDLKPLATNPNVLDHYKNKAAWAYLEQLPDDTGVALYWH